MSNKRKSGPSLAFEQGFLEDEISSLRADLGLPLLGFPSDGTEDLSDLEQILFRRLVAYQVSLRRLLAILNIDASGAQGGELLALCQDRYLAEVETRSRLSDATTKANKERAKPLSEDCLRALFSAFAKLREESAGKLPGWKRTAQRAKQIMADYELPREQRELLTQGRVRPVVDLMKQMVDAGEFPERKQAESP